MESDFEGRELPLPPLPDQGVVRFMLKDDYRKDEKSEGGWFPRTRHYELPLGKMKLNQYFELPDELVDNPKALAALRVRVSLWSKRNPGKRFLVSKKHRIVARVE